MAVTIVGGQVRSEPAETEVVSQAEDATQVRVRELIYVLRQYRPFDRTDEWCGAIQELTKIGEPTLPELLLELKQTERGRTLRAVLFTLRAINDPRALPFVIEALPKAERLSNDGSDDGLGCVNPTLHQFMRQHQNRQPDEDESFRYGRAINEILGTLHKLTKTALPDFSKEGPVPSWNANYWRAWWKAKKESGSAPTQDQALYWHRGTRTSLSATGSKNSGRSFPRVPTSI